MPDFKLFRAGPEDDGRRFDRILRILLHNVPLSTIYCALRTGRIRLNGKKSPQSRLIKAGDELSIPAEMTIAPSNSDKAAVPAASGTAMLDILFRNTDILAISKPRGQLSHGPGGLDQMLGKVFMPPGGEESLAFHPGPLHRLDRNTSGILCFSLSLRGAREGSRAFREGKVRKLYIGLFTGKMSKEESWIDRLTRDEDSRKSLSEEEGREARARFFPIMYNNAYSLGMVLLETGLNHQIRAQASLRSHPLAGDLKYGAPALPGGYFLHSTELGFLSDMPDILPPRISCPLPKSWKDPLEKIFGSGCLERAAEILSRQRETLTQPA